MGPPADKQPFNGLAEAGALEVERVVDATVTEAPAQRVDVKPAMGAMDLGDADERRTQQPCPGIDLGAVAQWAEAEVAGGTFHTGATAPDSQPGET